MPRVELIAMSGVRIVNPELRAMGLTLPGFIERGQVIASLPSLGLLTLAGATPEHWEIGYHEVDALDEGQIQALIGRQPTLIAISSLPARVDDAYALLDRFRAAGIQTVIGGLHASVRPDEAAQHADAVVVGQGEWVWPALLEDAERGALQPRYNGMHDPRPLEDTPLPRFDLLDPSRYNRIPLQTTRGCPLDCQFCAASRLISPYKRKSIGRVRQEIEAIQAIWPDPFIELADDNTFVNKKWGRELAELFCEFPAVKWFTETDLSLADDPELLRLLARSGCAQVLIGLESIQPESLRDTDTGHWKLRQREQYLEKIARIQDAGISVNGCFVFGFDSDTPATFDATLEFIQESGLSEVQITLLTPFPGTALFDQMKAQGRLLKDRFWDQCTLFDVTFRPVGFTVEELEARFQQMVAEVYSVEASRHRKALRTAIFRRRMSG